MVSPCEHDFGILLGFGTTTFKPLNIAFLPLWWVAGVEGWLLVPLLVVPHCFGVVAGGGGVLLIVTV